MPRYGRGRPAHPYISRDQVTVAINDSDVFGTTVEANTLTANVPSADTGVGAEASTIAASLTATDTATAVDSNTGMSVQSSASDTGSGAEASTIVATLSHSDTGGGVESGAPPPATLTTAETATGTDSYGVIGQTQNEPLTSTENTPRIGVTNSDSIALPDTETVDTFGGNSKLGQDTATFAESSSIVATVPTSADTGTSVDTQKSIGVDDIESILCVDRDSGFQIGIGVIAAETIASVETNSLSAQASSNEPLTYAETATIALVAPGLADNPAQIRDNGEPTIGVTSADTAVGVDAQGAIRVSGATETGTAVDASTIVANRTEAETLSYSEAQASPLVNLPTGIESLHYVEAGTAPVATFTSTETVSLVETENVDRGTPQSRLFIVDVEVRIKVIEAVTRVLQVPAEVRVLTVSGGFG